MIRYFRKICMSNNHGLYPKYDLKERFQLLNSWHVLLVNGSECWRSTVFLLWRTELACCIIDFALFPWCFYPSLWRMLILFAIVLHTLLYYWYNHVVTGICCFYGEMSIAPIPWPNALEAPSKNKVHVFSSLFSTTVSKRAIISSSGNSGCRGYSLQWVDGPNNLLEHCPW